MDQFEVGKSYATRSLADYDCILSFAILARTAKTVTIKVHGKVVKRGVSVFDGAEKFRPYGTYSMCPVVYADAHARRLADDAAKGAA